MKHRGRLVGARAKMARAGIARQWNGAGNAWKVMRASRALPIVFMLAAASMSACASALHLGPLQPPSTSAQVRPLAVPAAKIIPRPAMQLGIDIDFYSWPSVDVPAVAQADVAFIKRLHANAISISFPFFTDGARSSEVYATSATPSPAALATLVRFGEAAGLYVSIRPLLDEKSLGRARSHWRPANPAAWFASYQRFLLPYARMAQRQHIGALFVGAEFTHFESSDRWFALDKAVRRVYGGQLLYADNLTVSTRHPGGSAVPVVDAYRPILLPASASVAQLAARWRAYDRTFPKGTVIGEVGIAAVDGAYRMPWGWYRNARRIDPRIQVRWFTAACQAAGADHIGGVYFWDLNFGQSLTVPPPRAPMSFVARAGQSAISACFKYLSN